MTAKENECKADDAEEKGESKQQISKDNRLLMAKVGKQKQPSKVTF